MRGRRWTGVLIVAALAACSKKGHHEPPTPSATASAAAGSSHPADTAATAAAAPHDGQRPPKPTALASVPTPNLPKLNAQAPHPSAPPRKASKDEFPCGTVWTGEEEVPVQCAGPSTDTQNAAPAVTVLIPYDVLKPEKATLPRTVDHRLDGFEGRVLSQGHAPACTAFSLTSQINHAIGLWTSKPGDVSPMQIWARYHVGSDATRSNLGQTVARDADWPYDQVRAGAWSRCKGDDTNCLTDEEQQKLAALEKKPVAVLEQVERLPQDATFFDAIQAKLAAGRDIGTGGKLPKAFKPVGDPGSKYIPEFTDVGTGAHAFTLAGYTHIDDERYFLIKNSWGEKWGDGGYAWIHEQSLRKIIRGASVAVVDMVDTGGPRRKRRGHAAVTVCAEGKAPDSVDGACKPACADGSPRHDGYCGVTEDCAQGFVNVAGYCVLAAPTAKGTEPKTGIVFACYPSGCIYTVPKAVAASCAGLSCQKSCPAPDFRLGSGKQGLICLE